MPLFFDFVRGLFSAIPAPILACFAFFFGALIIFAIIKYFVA